MNGFINAPGRNEKGQLGVGDTKRRDVPTVIEALRDHNIVGAACGKNHTLILTGKSHVLVCLTDMPGCFPCFMKWFVHSSALLVNTEK
jgi:alpha-tubulin suppressor-like RCC1 family protein